MTRRCAGPAAAALLASLLGFPWAATAAGQGDALKAFEQELSSLAESSARYCVRVEATCLARTGPVALPGGRERVREERVIFSGILLDGEGHVVTLGRELAAARFISASLWGEEGERLYKAVLVGHDPATAIGVIQLEGPGPFQPPILANSDTLRPGALAIGLGYPFDLGPAPSVSIGHVSAMGRRFATETGTFTDLIEVSVPIKPGETGGPLVNSSGEVVGLLLTSFSGSRGSGNLALLTGQFPPAVSLAIPVNSVLREVERLLDDQEGRAAGTSAAQGYLLGFVAEEITDTTLRNQLNLPEGGVMIWLVYEGQPADRAGIRKYDILVEVKGEKVKNLDHLRDLLGGTEVGESLEVGLIRGGEKMSTKIVAGAG